MTDRRPRRADRTEAEVERDCSRRGPAVAPVLPPSLPWPGGTPWPEARRHLDDVAARRDRRPLIAALACLLLAITLLALAIR